MGYEDMTRSEIKRELRAAMDLDDWRKFGPRCWTCRKGVNFAAKFYPYALNKDVTYCKEWRELMEKPFEPSDELVECWEG